MVRAPGVESDGFYGNGAAGREYDKAASSRSGMHLPQHVIGAAVHRRSVGGLRRGSAVTREKRRETFRNCSEETAEERLYEAGVGV